VIGTNISRETSRSGAVCDREVYERGRWEGSADHNFVINKFFDVGLPVKLSIIKSNLFSNTKTPTKNEAYKRTITKNSFHDN